MRNLNIYLALLLCLLASKIFAQDPSQKGEQAEQTFDQAIEKSTVEYNQIQQEEEKIAIHFLTTKISTLMCMTIHLLTII